MAIQFRAFGDTDTVAGMSATGFQLPRALVAKVKAHRDAAGITTGECILRGFEAAHAAGVLPGLVDREDLAEDDPGPAAVGSLFAPRLPRSSRQAKTGMSANLRASDLVTIDCLVAEFGARSRTDLVRAVLQWWLDAGAPDPPGLTQGST